MARAWVVDRWVKDAIVALPDGTKTRISPNAQQLRSLKTLPDHFRTTLFGKGLRWAVCWYEPSIEGQKQRSKKFGKRADADAFAASLEDEIRSDRYIDPTARDQRFGLVAESWLSSKNRIKDSSWLAYRKALDSYVLPRWGETPIGLITRPNIDAWINELRTGTAVYSFKTSPDATKSKKPRKPKKPAPMKAASMRIVVSQAFAGTLRYAVREHLIGRSPFEHVELPADEADLDNDLPMLGYTAIDRLAHAAEELTGRESDRVLVDLLASSGPRIGEATALKIKDLDLSNKRARIHRTWTLNREGRRKLGPVKTGEKRWLPLAEHVVAGIRRIIKGRDPEDYVFITVRGAAVDSKNWYNRVWRKIRDVDGLATGMSVHDLRHVAATNAIAGGADVKLVQRMLGHQDATETLNTYAHLWPDRVDEVIASIETKRTEALALAA